MLDGDGRVRITDFGLAGLAGSFRTSAPARRPTWRRSSSPAASVTAQRPLRARPGAVRDLHRQARLRREDDRRAAAPARRRRAPVDASSGRSLDPAVERVIQRCLERDPATRPAERDRGVGGAAGRRSAGRGPRGGRDAVAGDGRRGRPHRAGAAADRPAAAGVRARVLSRLRRSAAARPSFTATFRCDCRRRCSRIARAGARRARLSRDAGRLGRPAALEHDYWPGRAAAAGQRWDALPTGRAPAIGYWHRTSPRPLVPHADRTGRRRTDPPLGMTGMTTTPARHARPADRSSTPFRRSARRPDGPDRRAPPAPPTTGRPLFTPCAAA